MPSVSAPQAGSTAAVGANEGLYEDFSSFTFITAAGAVAHREIVGTVWGSIAVTGSNWTFNPDTKFYSLTADPVTGSGTFTSRVSMNGSYGWGGTTNGTWAVTYSASNALAVSQQSVAGSWSTPASGAYATTVVVDANGVLTGSTSGSRFGVCQLSGSVLLAQPGTAKNMYMISLKAVNGATGSQSACSLDTTSPYAGMAAIALSPAGTYVSNGYFRNLAFMVKSGNGATLSLNLSKS